MCRILYKQNNSVIFDKKELHKSYIFNPDGTGIIYFDNLTNNLIVNKFPKGTNFDEIYNKVLEVEQKQNICNIAIHFRLGTGGGLGIEQVHPIKIKENMYLMHNGVCRDFDVDNTIASDTQWMAEFFKKNNFSSSILKDTKQKQIYENIFSGNKLVIFEKNNVSFINEKLGTWENGIWRSYSPASKYGWAEELEVDYDKTYNPNRTYIQRTIFDVDREIRENIQKEKQKWAKYTPEQQKAIDEIVETKETLNEIADELLSVSFERSEVKDNTELYDRIVDFISDKSFVDKNLKKIVWDRIDELDECDCVAVDILDEVGNKFRKEAEQFEKLENIVRNNNNLNLSNLDSKTYNDLLQNNNYQQSKQQKRGM